jgi:hypothetical protein
MRAMSLAAIATLWIATAPISANAADQIITESFSVTIPGSAVPNASQPDAQFESTPFPLFATSTGFLESAAFTLTGAVKVVSLNDEPDILIFLRDLTARDIGFGQAILKSGTTSVMFSGDAVPAAIYIGVGNGQVQLTLNTSDFPDTDLIESVGPLEGVVTYTYTPRTLAAIPETPTWAAMLVGFASLGFAGYRAKRKGRASNGVSRAH